MNAACRRIHRSLENKSLCPNISLSLLDFQGSVFKVIKFLSFATLFLRILFNSQTQDSDACFSLERPKNCLPYKLFQCWMWYKRVVKLQRFLLNFAMSAGKTLFWGRAPFLEYSKSSDLFKQPASYSLSLVLNLCVP